MAAVLTAPDGRILLARRPKGRAQAGYWEFPGGKIEPGEHPPQALQRELREELGVQICALRPLLRFRYVYPEREVELDFWRARIAAGTAQPQPLEGQELVWTRGEDLPLRNLLPANRSLATLLGLGRVVAARRRTVPGVGTARRPWAPLRQPQTVLLDAPRRFDRESLAVWRKRLRRWQRHDYQVLLALPKRRPIPRSLAEAIVGWTLPDRRRRGFSVWLNAWGGDTKRAADARLAAGNGLAASRPRVDHRVDHEGRLILLLQRKA